MIEGWRRLLAIFTARERLQIYLLLANATLMGLIDVAGIASVMPFIAVLLNDGIIESNPYLHAVYVYFGFESHIHFEVALGVFSLATLIVSNAFSAFEMWFMYRFCFLRTHSLCIRLLTTYLHQPYLAFLQRSRAELHKIIVSDVDRVVVGTLMAGIGLFADVVSALFIVALLFFVDFAVTAATLFALGASYLAVHLTIRKRVTQLGEEFVTLDTAIVARTQEALENMKEIKVTGREHEFVTRLAGPRHRFALNAIRHNTLDLVPSRVIEVVAFGAIIAVALYYLLGNDTSPNVLPVIALFAFAAYRLVPTLKEIFDGIDTIRYNAPALELISKDFDRTGAEPRARGVRRDSRPLQQGIEIENVGFAYPGVNASAVQGLTIRLPAGQLTCIMGPTGAGKSTALDLVLGLLRPDAGRILIDGAQLDASAADEWRASIGYVPQAVSLIDDTVASNIAFGMQAEDIDLTRVHEAARRAQIHDFIVNGLPNAYGTVLGERDFA